MCVVFWPSRPLYKPVGNSIPAVADFIKYLFCLPGATKVPERLPCLHQRGNGQHRNSALQDKGQQWQEPVCHDSQDAEGAGACGSTEGHVWKWVEEGMKGFLLTHFIIRVILLSYSLKEKDGVALSFSHCQHIWWKDPNRQWSILFDFLVLSLLWAPKPNLVHPEDVNLETGIYTATLARWGGT